MDAKPSDVRQQTIAMIAEVMWNGDGAPEMSEVEYVLQYVASATAQYNDWQAGLLDAWWQE